VMRKNHHEAQRLYFSPPFKDHPDRAVAAAYSQFVKEHGGLHHGIGAAMEYIAKHAPAMRDAFARSHSHRGSAAA
jgi:hypothetical protein